MRSLRHKDFEMLPGTPLGVGFFEATAPPAAAQAPVHRDR